MGLGPGTRDPGSVKTLFRIPEPGSRLRKVNGRKVNGSLIPVPQHCQLKRIIRISRATQKNTYRLKK
jgi:hypothetical protein